MLPTGTTGSPGAATEGLLDLKAPAPSSVARLCGTQWELPGLLGWDGHPCLRSFGVPLDLFQLLAQGTQLPPPGHFWNKLERSALGDPSPRGLRARRGPRLAATTHSAAKVDLGEVGAKELELSERNESRQGSPKKAQGSQAASPQSHLSGNKGLLCRALLARPRPALGGPETFPWCGPGLRATGGGTGHQAPGAEAWRVPRAQRYPGRPSLPPSTSKAAAHLLDGRHGVPALGRARGEARGRGRLVVLMGLGHEFRHGDLVRHRRGTGREPPPPQSPRARAPTPPPPPLRAADKGERGAREPP